MTSPYDTRNRILIVDDNPAIHDDFTKILGDPEQREEFTQLDAALFGESSRPRMGFELSSAHQGQDAIDMIAAANQSATPYAMAFVDVRMPPGIDGVETTARVLELDPDIQIVLCSAYSDYSWEDVRLRIGDTDRVLFLRKPFDSMEVQQLAATLVRKADLAKMLARRMGDLEQMVASRTHELEQANEQLRRDTARRLREERQLRFSQRLEALGRLTASIGHEINNPLSYMLANLGFARKVLSDIAVAGTITLEQLEDLDDLCESTSTGANRIGEVVSSIRSFSRFESATLGNVSLDTAIRKAALLSSNQVHHSADVELDIGDAATVRADMGRLEQVIVNLLLNADQAVRGRDNPRICVRTKTADNGSAVVEVSDNGAGISEHDLERVFDPFFTTLPVGEGTGLGLTICREIVSQFSGTIDIDSQVGAGTTVRIALPAVASCDVHGPDCTSMETIPVVSRTEISPDGQFAEGTGRIPTERKFRVLVVDDDPLVRKAVGRSLTEFEVFTADGVASATKLYAQTEIDLVLSDVMMPSGGGDQLYAELEAMGPGHAERVVFLTGGAFSSEIQSFLDGTGRLQLIKPLPAHRLRKIIRQQLQLVGPNLRSSTTTPA